LLLLALAGCVTSLPRRPPPPTGDPIVDGNAALETSPPKDRVLWDDRIAASALRVGRYGEARVKLDDSIAQIGGILGDSESARRARGVFHAESEKIFVGEPYERVMAYYYRGILYWRDGEPDNARACFRSAALASSLADDRPVPETYVLLDYLDGYASVKLGGDGADAFRRAQANAGNRPLPAYDARANVLVFAEFGQGPQKYASGRYGEKLRFLVADSRVHDARLTVEGRVVQLPAYDDLDYQAITRGGRVMDYILERKAVFKTVAGSAGDLALAGSAAAATRIYSENGRRSEGAEITAGALAAVGAVGELVSAATVARADTRCWNNLPQRLSFSSLSLPPGNHSLTLEFLDAQGLVCRELTRELTLHIDPGAPDTVLFLSELNR